MKSHNFLIMISFYLITMIQINACPTCIGKFDKNMPAFFEDEYEDYFEKNEFDETTKVAVDSRKNYEENSR